MSESVETLKARIAFLENVLQVTRGQRETALNAFADVSVQRDAAQHENKLLVQKLIALEDKMKTG